ncbi:glycosyltransferase [Pantanalinema sp. GBBB05]|uniref:glycosyltransferase n=1 Tax=Pantanalinema sp. GBBB05 TaxID=2604139 RepID=UPI001D94673D|nr:glycosyltransferase family 2 protein [Pantanalinema sp. GBBB05]
MSNRFDPKPPRREYRDRRLKAVCVVLLVWVSVSLLHWRPETQWLLIAFTGILLVQTTRMLLANPIAPFHPVDENLPLVTILVPAQNEQAVLANLVHSLFDLDYPASHLDIWVIDDGSTDATPQLLAALQRQFPRLQVYRREAGGGKSGALNAVLPYTRGDVVLICDADAQLPADFLQSTAALCDRGAVGAVQVRKSISNQQTNFLTRCQQMELSCDSWLQIHRTEIGGMCELRGNGMFVRRSLLEACQGWQEDTVTDDLDLTFRLYLAKTEIAFVSAIAIQEEGSTTWRSLWRQHCRWAEGGYQRYLDYFPQLLRLGWAKELDLLLFFVLQFLLPIALIPDLLWTLFYSHRPILVPLQMLFSLILTVAFIGGIRRYQNIRGVALLWATVLASGYMLHWIPIMIITTLRLCGHPQRLQWHKTEHHGYKVEEPC